MSEMLRGLMSSDAVKIHSVRCLYENEIWWCAVNFPDGSCEAIVGFCRLKDGLIIEMETGATPVEPKS